MKIDCTVRIAILLLSSACLATGEVLKVGAGETYATIQAAVTAAEAGDEIEVSPGTYAESVVIDTAPLVLRGAAAGTDARGRVGATPDPGVESIIAPTSGPAVSLETDAGGIEITGFSMIGDVSSGAGLLTNETSASAGLLVRENHIRVSAGATGSAVWLNSSATDASFERNDLVAAAGTVQAVFLDGADAFDGLRFVENAIRRDGAIGGTGFFVDGDRNVGPSGTRSPVFSGNDFEGHALGFNGGKRSLLEADITGNRFAGNHGGFAGGPEDCLFEGNLWEDNDHYGLRLTAFGETGAGYGAADNVIRGNEFRNNGAAAPAAGYGDLRVDDQPAGRVSSNEAAGNLLLSDVAVFQSEPDEMLLAESNYWGAADGPGGNGPGSGGDWLGAGALDFEPWYRDEALTTLDYGGDAIGDAVVLGEGESIRGASLSVGGDGSLVVGEGAYVDVDQLDLAAGGSLTVRHGAVSAGTLEAAPGASIEVIGGSLSLDPTASGESHTISGTFTLFDSLGSMEILEDTTFSGSTLGIISDIHVAAGVNLTVTGSLIFDGCTLDSPGSFNFLINPGAEFELIRCDVTGASVVVASDNTLLRDSVFRDSSITVFGSVSGAEIYHNVFEDGPGTLNALAGANLVDSREGWGNVTDASQVRNELALMFASPGLPDRTLAPTGELYVQPGDAVTAALEIGKLFDKAQAVETVLGYSSDRLAFAATLPSADWPNQLYEDSSVSGAIGRVNSAIGLDFDAPDPDGTLNDGTVAEFALSTTALEGETRVFFRRVDAADAPVPGNRITASAGGAPYVREFPFTANSPRLTVDGTDPVFAGGSGSAVQVQESTSVDVLQSGVVTRQGIVTVTFDARDELAGIDSGDASVAFNGPAGTLGGILVSTAEVVVGSQMFTRYEFEVTVGPGTPNGVYNVDASVTDRSGNSAALPIGAVEINKNRIVATVAPQGLTTGAVSRDVTFVATDSSGGVLKTWVPAVGFSSGVGSAILEEVPDGTDSISAKTDWHLRVRLPAGLDVDGQASVSFAGASELPGGDFNGDNFVSLPDFSLLENSFLTADPQTDITGDGFVNLPDFSILEDNWLTGGDTQ